MNIEAVRGEITLDSSGYKRGLDDAAKATQRFASEADRANADVRAFMQALERENAVIKGNTDALKQETAFLKEMAAAEARLTAIHQGQSKAAQDVAAKYHELSAAQRMELVAAQNAIASHEAQEKALAKLGAEAERMPQRLRQMGRAMSQVGREMTQTITLPIVAAGAAVLKAGIDVDKGMDAIRLATGATGQQMKGLEASFKAVGGSVPNSLADVGKALGEVATRTGLTGPPLEALTRRLLTVSRLTGTELGENVKLSTRLFGDWGVAAGKQSQTLDLLFRASQRSGLGFGALSRELVQFGAPLRTVGFSLEQSVALFAKWHKEGVNAEQIATSIRIAISRMVKAGVQDVPGAFQQAIKAIQAAKTPADQLSLSFKLFGARAGTDMARAIREGRFAIDDLVRSLAGSGGAIDAAAKKTDDFGERFGVLRNKVELALNPLGSRLMDALDNMGRALTANVPRLTALVDGFLKLPVPVQRAAEAALLIAAGAGPALVALGKLVQGWGALQLIMQSAAVEAGLAQAAILGPWIAAAIAAIAALAYAWNTDLGGMKTAIVELGKEISEWWGKTVQPVFASFASAWHGVAESLKRDSGSMVNELHRLAGNWREADRLMDRTPTSRAIGAVRNFIGSHLPGSGIAGFATGLLDRAHQRAAQAPIFERFPVAQFGAKFLGPAVPAGFTPSAPPTAPAGVNPADWMSRLGKTGTGKPKLSDEQREGKRFAEELAQAQARLAQVLAGEDNIAAQVAARYHLLSAARREDLVHVLRQIKAAEDEKKAHLEVVAALDGARLALLKSRAAAGAGEYSRQTVALDLFKKGWTALSKEQRNATDQALKWKIEQKGLDQGKQQLDSLKNSLADLQLEYEGLTAATEVQRFAAITLHRHWGTMTDDEKMLAAQMLQMKHNIEGVNAANKAAAAEWKQHDDALNSLNDAYAQATLQHMRLSGATREDTEAFKALTRDLDLTDGAVLDLIQSYLALLDANENLAKMNEHNRQVLEQQGQAYDNLLGTFQDLSTQYGLMTGQISDADVFWRQITEGLDMTDEAAVQLALSVYDLYKQTQKMSEGRKFMENFAQGTEQIFGDMFSHLMQHGFKGFFRGVIDGFKQMLQQMAAQYLASKLAELVFGKQNQQGGRQGGLVDVIGTVIGSLFGHKALGGPVSAGRPYMVGEAGRELFVPSSSGRIVPNNQLAGVGGGNSTIIVNVQGEHLPQARRNASALAATLNREMTRQQRRNGNG